ncbi:MAG: Phenazine biosynthesis protein PhzF like [Pseudolabrys sp.]|jgi:trans-2,3-dihydro-3-hydroxyanthranilate isomerase|nr:Phenazine biosynthesis protein PhzF like [Pseudolabrys sp.]
MRRRYVTLDVFTLKRFSGNPLAAVFDAEGLDTATMQTLAREFNYPETVFVSPPDSASHRAALRIFTPANELPFAGHPTVGAAVALARSSGGPKQAFVVEEKVGPVPCEVALRDADSGEATFTLPQLPARAGEVPGPEATAAALGLAPSDIGGDLRAGRWSAGVPFVFVPVKSLAAMAKARPDPARFDDTFGAGGPGKAYLVCREVAEPGHDFHARMFAPKMGIAEDPATGSAVAAFGGLLAEQASLKNGTHRFRIEQGYEMGRPSQIDLTLTMTAGRLTRGTIGGGAVVICEGTIEA